MEIIQESKDIFYIIISFCVLWLTIFLAWLIYYLVMIVRQIYVVIKDFREKINKVDETIKNFKEKMEHSASYLALISEGVKKITDVVKEHTSKSKKGKKK